MNRDEYGYINEMDMSRRRGDFWRGEYLKKGEWLKNERKIGLHDNMLCSCCFCVGYEWCLSVWSGLSFSSAHDWQLGCYFAGLYFGLSGFVVTCYVSVKEREDQLIRGVMQEWYERKEEMERVAFPKPYNSRQPLWWRCDDGICTKHLWHEREEGKVTRSCDFMGVRQMKNGIRAILFSSVTTTP